MRAYGKPTIRSTGRPVDSPHRSKFMYSITIFHVTTPSHRTRGIVACYVMSPIDRTRATVISKTTATHPITTPTKRALIFVSHFTALTDGAHTVIIYGASTIAGKIRPAVAHPLGIANVFVGESPKLSSPPPRSPLVEPWLRLLSPPWLSPARPEHPGGRRALSEREWETFFIAWDAHNIKPSLAEGITSRGVQVRQGYLLIATAFNGVTASRRGVMRV